MVSRFIINHINTHEDFSESIHRVAVKAASDLDQKWREDYDYILENDNVPCIKDTAEGKDYFLESIHRVALKAASDLHQNWRDDYILKNGNVPRIKDTPDGEVDINVPFDQVHPIYQKANLTMATFVIKMLCLFARDTTSCEEDVRIYYRLIHDFWLQENPHAENGPLDVPWDDLPKIEQDKDVAVYMVCNEHYTMSLWGCN